MCLRIVKCVDFLVDNTEIAIPSAVDRTDDFDCLPALDIEHIRDLIGCCILLQTTCLNSLIIFCFCNNCEVSLAWWRVISHLCVAHLLQIHQILSWAHVLRIIRQHVSLQLGIQESPGRVYVESLEVFEPPAWKCESSKEFKRSTICCNISVSSHYFSPGLQQ